MNQALVIIDIQNDYFTGGKMELNNMENASINAQHVLHLFRSYSLPVFHIQHLSIRPGATFFIPNTIGVEIHKSVAPKKNEPVIRKHFPNSFRNTVLLDQLRLQNIDELTFCGAMSHMCVDTTVRAAFDLGFRCNVISDACATKDIDFEGITIEASQVHAAFMSALSSPFAQIIDTKKLETQLLR